MRSGKAAEIGTVVAGIGVVLLFVGGVSYLAGMFSLPAMPALALGGGPWSDVIAIAVIIVAFVVLMVLIKLFGRSKPEVK